MNAEQRQALLGAIKADPGALALLLAGDIYSLRLWIESPAGQAARREAGLTYIQQPSFVGEGTVTEVLGDPVGPMFIMGLESEATRPLAQVPTDQLAMHARVVQAWRLLQTGSLDVGLKVTRDAFAATVGVLTGFTQEVCDALLGHAEMLVYVQDEDLNVLVPEPEGNHELRANPQPSKEG